MLPRKMAKKKPSHEVSMAPIDCLQVGSTLPRNPEAVEINISRTNTPEVHRIKIINLGLVKAGEESRSLAHRIWNCSKNWT